MVTKGREHDGLMPPGPVPDATAYSREPAIPRPGDTVIAIMGVTGVGKSTFISYFCPDAQVGDSLVSCTAEVSIHEARVGDEKCFLIDTPGFNDTHRSDTDILREVADWLNRSYEGGIKLAGIVYLHRINDNRMTGANLRNIRLFKKLCGDKGLSCVVLATTMWSYVSPDEGNRREEELTTQKEFWGGMVEKGSKVFRQDSGFSSALGILHYIINQRHRITLQIQEEMASGKSLDQTAAGSEVQAELEKLKEEHKREIARLREEMEEAREENDRQAQREIAELRASIEARIKKDEEDRKRMEVTIEQLQKERDKEIRIAQQEAHERELDHQRRMLDAKSELAMVRQQSEYEAKLAQERLQNEISATRIARFEAEEAQRRRKEQDACVVM